MIPRTLNPRLCWFFGDSLHVCTWMPPMIQRYLARISSPLLDLIYTFRCRR
jgi:predicted ATPase with chaperone activity